MEQQTLRRSSRILIDAVCKLNYEAVERMLKSGSNVNEKDYNGNCALYHAARLNDLNMFRLLLKYDADINLCDLCNIHGKRLFKAAVETKDFTTLKTLIKKKVRIDVEDIDHILKEFPRDVRDLFYNHVSTCDTDSAGYTALHRVVENDDLDGIRKLLSRGADINNQTSERKITPLHLAKSAECVKLLLAEGANPNMEDHAQNTALYRIALQEENSPGSIRRDQQARMIEMLVSYGADCAVVFYTGRILLEYGTNFDSLVGFKDILKYIAISKYKYELAQAARMNFEDETDILSLFYKKCLDENKRLRHQKVLRNKTYLQLILMSIPQLSKYVYQEKIFAIFKNTSQLRLRFPVYFDILQRHYYDALILRNAREIASLSLSIAIPCISPDHIVTEKILEFLEKEDMQKLIIAYSPVSLIKS